MFFFLPSSLGPCNTTCHMNCSVMASKVGALAVGAKADNTSEANGLIPPDKFCDNPSCLAHSFLPKPSTEDCAQHLEHLECS